MSFRGRLIAALVVKLPECEGRAITIEADLYEAHDRNARERYCYVERELGERVAVLVASSPEDLLRVILAQQSRTCAEPHGYLARTVFAHAGFDIDEDRLRVFEEALDAIAEVGDERVRRDVERKLGRRLGDGAAGTESPNDPDR